MKFEVLLGGNPEPVPPGADVRETEPGVYSVLLDGVSYEVRITGTPAALAIESKGVRFEGELRDPRESQRRGRGAAKSGRQDLVAPMPGKVIRLLVAEGETVQAGQGLIVVEAMKMQNEMKAARAGRVVKVLARPGDTVAGGSPLVTIE